MSTNGDDAQAGFAAEAAPGTIHAPDEAGAAVTSGEAVWRLPDLARVASAPGGETVSFKKKR